MASPLRTRIGRVSELLDIPRQRSDWSGLNSQLKALEPGQQLEVVTPTNLTVPSFRSTILTAGQRIHKGDWRLCTRTEGRKIHCFLAPR
jgi:hypothetical protein